MRLSTSDRKILNCAQEDIPLCPEPFKVMSERLGVKEDELLSGLRRLKKKGIIRNYAVRISHKKLGFTSTLIALRVQEGKIESIVKKIIGYPEVTHCYLREGEYNLWLVFISNKREKQKLFLKKLAGYVGRGNTMNLSTKRQFKLKTKFDL